MRRMMSTLVIAAFVVALAVASGCVDTPLVAPTDYKMTLTANPSNVVVPTLPPPDEGVATSDIVATVLSDTGIPQRGYSVYFSASSGTLDSYAAITTDDNGRARNRLTIKATDQAEIQVTASSGALVETVSVTQNGVCDSNVAPTAVLSVDPATLTGIAGSEQHTTATGSASSDPSPGAIAEYDWDCGDGTGIHTTVPSTSTYTCTYTLPTASTTKTITLVVWDNGDGEGGTPPACRKSSTPKTSQITITVTP